MAEEEKGGRRRSPLYDDKSSRKMEKPERGDTAEPKAKGGEGPAPKEGATGDDREAAMGGGVMERHENERMALHHKHEAERRDMHGNHREEHRKMHGRHEKDHKELADKHMAEMQSAMEGEGMGGMTGGPADMQGGNAPPNQAAGAMAAAAPNPAAGAQVG